MKITFPQTVWARFTALVIKLISVKSIPAVIATIGYFGNTDIINGGLMAVTWALVISFRYAEKVKGLIK
jgi:hypothetical protein